MYCEYVAGANSCTAGKAVMPDGKFNTPSGSLPSNGGFSLPARAGFLLRRCNSRFSPPVVLVRCTPAACKRLEAAPFCRLFYSDFMTDSSCW